MAEFDPTTPAIRLFDEVDLAPAPQSVTLQRVLNFWREERADQGELVPPVTALQSNMASTLTPPVFIFSPTPDQRNFTLRWAGERAIEVFGCKGAEVELSKLGNRRVAVYARRLFEMVESRKEAVCVRFTQHACGAGPTIFEMLAAPARNADGADWIFGAIVDL